MKGGIFGLVVGDALGVPVEFQDRAVRKRDPVLEMRGGGAHGQLPGTWSDDSSLALCLLDALTKPFDINQIANTFVSWYYNSYWTARGSVFDVGGTTKYALQNIARGTPPEKAGSYDFDSNGNGSLMRILPLAFFIREKPLSERYELVKQVSSITHGNIVSVISCFYYIEFALQLLEGKGKIEIFYALQKQIPEYLQNIGTSENVIKLFDLLFKENIYLLSEDRISSSGYVLYTLEASIWCLLTTDTYKDSVLKAVNLGEDTDTTAAVTGGLAGICYGFESIPAEWINQLARAKDINDLIEKASNVHASVEDMQSGNVSHDTERSLL